MNKNKGFTLLSIILVVITILVVGSISYYAGKKNISVLKKVEVMPNDNNQALLLTIHQTQEPNKIEVSIINPISDTLITKKNVALDYPLMSYYNSKNIVVDSTSKTIYVKTLGNLVPDSNTTGEYDGPSVCPTQGECFDFAIESFSFDGSDKPVFAYKNIIKNNSFIVDIEKYKDTPFITLLKETRQSPELSTIFTPTPINGLSMKFGPLNISNTISLKKDSVIKEIPLSGDIYKVAYLVSPDKKYVYITSKEFNPKLAPNLVSNSFKVGLEKIDVENMSGTEIAKNIVPETFSPDGKYLAGFWKIDSGTIIVLLNTETGERKELKSITPVPSEVADRSMAPNPFFMEWLNQ